MPIRKTRRCFLAAALILLAPTVLGAAQDSSIEQRYPLLDLDSAMLTSDDAQPVGRGQEPVFVVPSEGARITVRPGDFVNLHGEIRLSATRRQRDASLNLPTPRLTPYVYAYTVRPAS
jgi:hypothetical protein